MNHDHVRIAAVFAFLSILSIGLIVAPTCNRDGDDGTNGSPGSTGPAGSGGIVSDGNPDPLSGMVAVRLNDSGNTGATNIADFVKARVDQYARNTLPSGYQFPLANSGTDTVRCIQGLVPNLVVKWLDPLTFSTSGPRFGANCDYIAFFGDGWDAVAGNPPQWNGSSTAAWIWVNHEYISNNMPDVNTVPTGQHLVYAKFLQSRGLITFDPTVSGNWTQGNVDIYIRNYKKEVGGSWFHIIQDPATGEWQVDRTAAARRFDAVGTAGAGNATLLRVQGATVSADTLDDGTALGAGIVVGITGDCSGGQSPWGTVFTAEENIQDYYGDLEDCWSSQQKFVANAAFPASGTIAPTVAPTTSGSLAEFGRISVATERHNRDLYGWLCEMDPAQARDNVYDSVTTGGDGLGHRKMGPFGRARWENCAFVTDANWRLVSGQPIVMYGSNDRRGGRIYKWVSAAPYTSGMTRGQIRALLDTGSLYVAHFAGLNNATGNTMLATSAAPTQAAPGSGAWYLMSTTNTTQTAPNAGQGTNPAGTSVGTALTTTYNGIGAFPDQDTVLKCLFTAEAKLGIMELNRPEDIEWNPIDNRIYLAFTNHTGQTQLDQNGVLNLTTTPQRNDRAGQIWVLQEATPTAPGTSNAFTFWEVWKGTGTPSSPATGPLDASCPDNLMIDRQGGVWFGTDGNFGVNAQRADALYYIDLNPAHQSGQPGIVNASYGKAFRVIAGPSDSEATGPCFSSDMRTIFFDVQHPGESNFSTWP
jgi:hypothetical protein